MGSGNSYRLIIEVVCGRGFHGADPFDGKYDYGRGLPIGK